MAEIIRAGSFSIPVLYEDNHLLVVVKPANLPSQGDSSGDDDLLSILKRYIVFNLLDSLIVGGANAIFMAIVGMPYVGLVSFVVAIANLIPTFGPVIGALIGGFVLLMVNPWHALAFLIFTFILQTVDGYILKPKMFGDSLGVSGLWILVGVIVGGRAFGVVGILLAIPGVAILDFLYQEYFLPWLETRERE